MVSRRPLLLGLPALALARPAVAQAPSATAMAERTNRLGEELFARVVMPRASIVLSPLSLFDAVVPLGPGSRGEAATVAAVFLGRRRADALALHGALAAGGGALTRAAAVWLPPAPPARERYRTALVPFGTHLEQVDFATPAALGRINGWVSERTRDLIPTLFDELPRDASVVVTAAMHFAARWATPFDPEDTRDAPFTRGDGTPAPARYMRATRTLAYAEERNWQAIRLAYAQAEYEATVLLPAPGRPLGQAAQLLRDGRLAATLSQLRFADQEVALMLPRLALRHEGDILAPLRATKLRPVFSPDADYRGITGAPVRITAVRQHAVLRVDEAGTEAAAATGVVGSRSLADRVRFEADRPFVFLVTHKPSGLVVVAALVNEPGAA